MLLFIIFLYFLNSNVFSLLRDESFEADEKDSCIFHESITL